MLAFVMIGAGEAVGDDSHRNRVLLLCDSLSHPAQKDYLLDLNLGNETLLGSGPEK